MIPQHDKARYLGLWFDKHLSWSTNIKNKQLTLNPQLKQLYCLTHDHFFPFRNRKFSIQKTTASDTEQRSQLFGSAAKLNTKSIQIFQSKFLRIGYYVSNSILYKYLNIEHVSDLCRQISHDFMTSYTTTHQQMVTRYSPLRQRLRRNWPSFYFNKKYMKHELQLRVIFIKSFYILPLEAHDISSLL